MPLLALLDKILRLITEPLMEIITRESAARDGRKRYYTGRPCKRGHDCERFVSSGGCVMCVNPTLAHTVNPLSSKFRTLYIRPWVLMEVLRRPQLRQELEEYLQMCANHWSEQKAKEDIGLSLDLKETGGFRPNYGGRIDND